MKVSELGSGAVRVLINTRNAISSRSYFYSRLITLVITQAHKIFYPHNQRQTAWEQKQTAGALETKTAAKRRVCQTTPQTRYFYYTGLFPFFISLNLTHPNKSTSTFISKQKQTFSLEYQFSNSRSQRALTSNKLAGDKFPWRESQYSKCSEKPHTTCTTDQISTDSSPVTPALLKIILQI